MDDELFRLCRSVYEATGWHNTHDKYRKNGFIVTWGYMSLMKGETPLYNSDYLLEKLPERILIDKQYRRWLSMDNLGSDGWQFSYRAERTAPIYASVADTPLKALLKLVLKLHEEKLL